MKPAILLLKLIGLACAASLSTLAQAAWPEDKPIRLVVPFTAGGTADALGRSLAQQLAKELGQTIIVENKPGAGSMLGTREVAGARPDGYTLLLGTTANVFNKYFYKKPLYDLQRDLTPISQLVEIPNFLAVNPKLPIETLAELIRYARAHPDQLSCAHSGIGASPFVACELFKKMAQVRIVSVPYQGGTQAISDVIGGTASLVFQSEALSYIRAGQLRPIGVTTASRSPFLKDTPAIAAPLPGYEVSAWYGLLGPAALPSEISARLAQAVMQILRSPEMQERLALVGGVAVGSEPAAFKKKLDADLAFYDQAIPALGVNAD